MKSKQSCRVKKNEKGELKSLLASSVDGQQLKMYVENGAIDGSMKAMDVKVKFPQFQKYDYACLNSALRRARNLVNKLIVERGNLKNGCEFFYQTLLLLCQYSLS